MSGARPGATPSSPSNIGRATNSTGSSRTARSGVTTTHCSVLASAMSLPFRLALGLLGRLVDAADVHERALGQVVPLALAQLLEAADRLGQRRHLALLAGERLGHEERLRQELLDAAGPVHHLLVLLAQLLDAEDGDDVLQLAVALQDLLDAVGDGVVLLADVLRLEDVAVGGQRVHGRVDALLADAPLQVDKGVEVL